MTPSDLKPGDELTTAWLNEGNAQAEAGQLSADPSSGMLGQSLPSGVSFRLRLPPEGWFTVHPAGPSDPAGSYRLTEAVDLPIGMWAVGPRSVYAFPIPGSGAPATNGSVTVRAWKDRASWRFAYNTC